MARNVPASGRGFGWDPDTRTLDLFAAGKIASKYGGESPDIYSTSTSALCDLGTRLQTGEQVFRYCKAGSALTRYVAGCNDDQWGLTNEQPNQSAAIGATSIQVVNTTATKDQFKGGYVAIFTSPLQVRRIVANDASDGTDTTLYLDGPLEAAITLDATWVTGYPSIYSDVTSPDNTSGHVDYITFVAIPVCTVASGSYFWGQTWGPCYGVAGATVPGSAMQQREIYFSTAGNLLDYGDASAGSGAQYAGYLLPRTSNGAGDQFYMLQLAP